MRQNVSLNDLDTSVTTAELNWGQPIVSPVPQKPDIILAADCVYFEPAFPLLVQTLVELSTPETDILFAYKKRRKVCGLPTCQLKDRINLHIYPG